MGEYIIDVYPQKAQFLKNEKIEITIEVFNPTEVEKEFELEVRISYLSRVEDIQQHKLIVLPGNLKVHDILLKQKDVEFKGYGVDIFLYEQGVLQQEVSSSFDVVSDWRRAPRYGFLSDFYPQDKGDDTDVKNMRKFHINLVQFYDWMYRHDNLIPPDHEFVDLMGRKLDFDVVKEKVALCHKYGMKAIGYGAVYAASNEFFDQHPDWALYNSSGEALSFINIFKIMNISPESPWCIHIVEQYRAAIQKADFDGIHMDTYGFPKTALSRLNGVEKIEKLEADFPVLIDYAHKELSLEKEDICLIFNNVGNWPVDTVAKANQDAIYIEVWEPYERYWHIQSIIHHAQLIGAGKPVILAAYMKPFMSKEQSGMLKAQTSTLILTAVIAANGSYHLLLGEKDGILTQAYYVDYFKMDDKFSYTMRRYYDFIVRYSNVLFNNSLRDVSMTHVNGDNREYIFENFRYSTYGEPGKVWVIVRESSQFKCISFINLSNNDDYWNEGKKEPILQQNLKVKVLVETMPKAVYAASPDRNLCRPEKIEYTVYNSDRGKYIFCSMDELKVWNLLVVEF